MSRPLARWWRLADHPYPIIPAFCDAIVICDPEGPEPRDAGAARATADIVDEVLAQGVWIMRAHRIRGQELVEARSIIRLAVTAALLRKKCKRGRRRYKGRGQESALRSGNGNSPYRMPAPT
ncbi:hypothetical protein V8E53_008111 [Lactarius tabidus]